MMRDDFSDAPQRQLQLAGRPFDRAAVRAFVVAHWSRIADGFNPCQRGHRSPRPRCESKHGPPPLSHTTLPITWAIPGEEAVCLWSSRLVSVPLFLPPSRAVVYP